MLNPAIGKLIESYENRYKLVIDVAKRAREISDRAEENHEILTEKPITLCNKRNMRGNLQQNRPLILVFRINGFKRTNACRLYPVTDDAV